MVARYAQADLAVDFEAAGGGEEAERGRAERVGGREDDAAVVGARGVGGGGGAAQGEVPFEEVVVERGGVEGGVRVGLELAGFGEDAFDGGGFGVEGGEGHGLGGLFGGESGWWWWWVVVEGERRWFGHEIYIKGLGEMWCGNVLAERGFVKVG